jgi:hypothetical protein
MPLVISNIVWQSVSQQEDKKSDVSTNAFYKVQGSLKRIAAVSKSAGELFGDLINLMQETNDRIGKVKSRIETIVIIENITKPKEETASEQTGGSYHAYPYPPIDSVVDRKSLSALMNRSISKLLPNPSYNGFEKYAPYFAPFRQPNQKSFDKGYSNPDYFFHEWIRVQAKRMNALEKHKKQMRSDKKKRQQKEREEIEMNEPKRKSKEIQKLNWQDRYDESKCMLDIV